MRQFKQIPVPEAPFSSSTPVPVPVKKLSITGTKISHKNFKNVPTNAANDKEYDATARKDDNYIDPNTVSKHKKGNIHAKSGGKHL